jgi:hypothetical protein
VNRSLMGGVVERDSLKPPTSATRLRR